MLSATKYGPDARSHGKRRAVKETCADLGVRVFFFTFFFSAHVPDSDIICFFEANKDVIR